MMKPSQVKRITPEALKAWRVALGMTLLQLADELGVSLQAVGHWETGSRTITARTQRQLQALAERWDVAAPAIGPAR